MTSFDAVLPEPGSNSLVVVAKGQGYVIDPLTRVCTRLMSPNIDAVLAAEDGTLILSNGLWLEALGAEGLRWKTRRISWDGFEALRLEGTRVLGRANALGDVWEDFEVDVETGELRGGGFPAELP